MPPVLPSRFRPRVSPSRLARLLLATAAVVLAVEGVYAVLWRTNDFSVHLRYGEAFLAGVPYPAEGVSGFYPLGRMWLNAGLASIEYYTCRSLCYVAAVLALGLTFRMWAELAQPAAPLSDARQASAIGWTAAVLFPFLIRDLDDCGLQLFLLFFLTAGGYALAHGRRPLAGFWLGLAIVYKATPLLFLPLLIWKREWRAAGWTAAFAVALSLLPATYLGWGTMLDLQRTWFDLAGGILQGQEAYPSVPGIEPPKPQNVSLRAAIARYLETHPSGHPLHSDHPLFVQFGDLSPDAAKRAVMAAVLVLGGLIAWRMRRRWVNPSADPNFAPEWATACLFAALMSPICWRQHLVVAIPCVYLVARERLHPLASGGWRKWTPAVAAAVFLLSRRQVIGEDLAHLVVGYKFDTLGVLAYAAMSLTLPRRADAEAMAPAEDATSLSKAA